MKTREWDESKHPRDELGRFTDASGAYRQNASYREISYLSYLWELTKDEQLPHSVGAKWANYNIRMPDGTTAKFVEGAKLEHKDIIAGYGQRRKIDIINKLVTTYPETSSTPRFWAKLKGVSDIVLEDGTVMRSEVHWYEHPKVGKIGFKYKEDIDED